MKTHAPRALVLSVVALTLLKTAPAHAEQFDLLETEGCAQTPSDLHRLPALKSALGTFGGLEGLALDWKMSGLIGAVAGVKVQLRYNASGFYVRVNEDPIKTVWLCADSAAPTILRLRVLQARLPELGLLLAKAGEVQKSLFVASKKSGWKFMKFKRNEKAS